jgi:hypothetical protein
MDKRATKSAMTLLALALLMTAPTAFQSSSVDQIKIIELASGVVVCDTPNGNVLASVGPEGAFITGPVTKASTRDLNVWLADRTSSSVRYVVAQPGRGSNEGDGGWGKLGSVVAMHENALHRLGATMAPASAPPKQLADLGVDRPRLSFSDVLAFDLNGESIHVVHQPAGYSDSDLLTHFHRAHVVYLGESYPGDGYPFVDATQGGTLDGLLKTLAPWTAAHDMRIVPARGSVKTSADLAEFRQMIVTAQERVQSLVRSGSTLDQLIQARPTAEFDKRWAQGRVSPETFIRELYESVRK